MTRPSGNDRQRIGPAVSGLRHTRSEAWPTGGFPHHAVDRPDSMFQMRTRPSPAALASKAPSGDHAVS